MPASTTTTIPINLQAKRLAIVGALLCWCALLIAFRFQRTGIPHFTGLCWNLFLALIPLLASGAMKAAKVRGRTTVQLGCFGLWLLFLPNAPYLLTDVLHLARRPPVPMWYDLSLLLSFAGTGLLFCYLSLVDVHLLVEQRFGVMSGWIAALGALIVCGFGVYVGRFLRWNSWDALTNPLALAADLAASLLNTGDHSHPHPATFTLVFGGALILGYAALRVVAASMIPGSAAKNHQ